jgi:hypothetical protein
MANMPANGRVLRETNTFVLRHVTDNMFEKGIERLFHCIDFIVLAREIDTRHFREE